MFIHCTLQNFNDCFVRVEINEMFRYITEGHKHIVRLWKTNEWKYADSEHGSPIFHFIFQSKVLRSLVYNLLIPCCNSWFKNWMIRNTEKERMVITDSRACNLSKKDHHLIMWKWINTLKKMTHEFCIHSIRHALCKIHVIHIACKLSNNFFSFWGQISNTIKSL